PRTADRAPTATPAVSVAKPPGPSSRGPPYIGSALAPGLLSVMRAAVAKGAVPRLLLHACKQSTSSSALQISSASQPAQDSDALQVPPSLSAAPPSSPPQRIAPCRDHSP